MSESSTTLPFRFRYDRFGNPAIYWSSIAVAHGRFAYDPATGWDPLQLRFTAAYVLLGVIAYFIFV